jgi:2-polyprenyl-3-methyl-5-hydroxy-6-metoxy-1,4-benzoquinol methylase
MMNKNQAISGGMPVYKYVGNKVLTSFENLILRTRMSEFHSGYRMYSTTFLNKVPFHENTDVFYFDTEIIIQARHLGSAIEEVPIQAFYGDEDCNVNGFAYALDVCKAVILYRLHQLHIIRKANYIVNRSYVHKKKTSAFSSHQIILNDIPEGTGRILYIGKNENLLSDELLQKGYSVDLVLDLDTELVSGEKGLSVERQNFQNLQLEYDRVFDYVILGDVLSQTANPEELVRQAHRILKLDGTLVCSVPNIAIWLYRLSLLIGRFNYGPAGTLDYRNLRFFTKFSLLRVFKRQGLVVDTVKYTSLPFEVFFESSGKSLILRLIDRLYYLKVKLWPSMFSYQFVTSVKVKSLVDEVTSSIKE